MVTKLKGDMALRNRVWSPLLPPPPDFWVDVSSSTFFFPYTLGPSNPPCVFIYLGLKVMETTLGLDR